MNHQGQRRLLLLRMLMNKLIIPASNTTVAKLLPTIQPMLICVPPLCEMLRRAPYGELPTSDLCMKWISSVTIRMLIMIGLKWEITAESAPGLLEV